MRHTANEKHSRRNGGQQSNETKESGKQARKASRGVSCPPPKEEQDPYRTHLYRMTFKEGEAAQSIEASCVCAVVRVYSRQYS